MKNSQTLAIHCNTPLRTTAPTIQYWDGRLATINTPEYSRFLLEYPGICYWLGTANPGVEERR